VGLDGADAIRSTVAEVVGDAPTCGCVTRGVMTPWPRDEWFTMLRYLRVRYRQHARRVRRFVLVNLLHANDPPHRLAMGCAIGMFIAFTPTIGVQMMLTVFLAWLLRANKVVGVPFVWISNPATFVPMYYSCYVVGCWMLGWHAIDRAWWTGLAHPPAGWLAGITFYWSRLGQVATPLWLGCVVIGVLLAYPTYYVVYQFVRSYRLRRWGQLMPPSANK